MKLIAFCAAMFASALLISNGPVLNEASATEGNTPLERLVAGNLRFTQGNSTLLHEGPDRRAEVAKGQHPFAVIVGCSDSRVPPEVLFDQGLGDLFVVRSAGHVLGDAAIGSIEYAVEYLGCELVVVLGHERCGTVKAVVDGGDLPAHMTSFTPAILPVVDGAKKRGGEVLDHAVRANASRTARQLAECEPVLSEYVHLGKVKVVGAHYDLDTGLVEFLDPRKSAGASRSGSTSVGTSSSSR